VSIYNFFTFLLESIVAASGYHSDQENGQSRIWLHVVYCPILILVGEIRYREAVRQDDYHLHEGAGTCYRRNCDVELAALGQIVIESDEGRKKQEELEIICNVPSPWETGILFSPGNHIIEEDDVPEPVL
jgi:hypothetical protein